jgi:toxin FitB
LTYLLDTNVVSELRKPCANQAVRSWFAGVDSSELYLSVLVVGEVRQGIDRLIRRGDRTQAQIYERWLATLEREFADRLLPVSVSVAERWGSLNAVRILPTVDGLLAATAIEHDLTFVTRDVDAVAESGVRALDPWASR